MIKICSSCHGSGKSFHYEGKYHEQNRVEILCDRCKGSGRLAEIMVIDLPYNVDYNLRLEVDKKINDIKKILKEIDELYGK